MDRRFLFSALILVVLSAACVGHRHQPFDGQRSGGAGQPLTPVFAWDLDHLEVSNADVPSGDSRHYTVKHLGFDSVGRNGQRDDRVDVLWYRGRAEGPLPAVVVLPIWGNYVYPPNRIAAGLRKRGAGRVHVLHLQGERRVLDWDALAAAGSEEEFLERMADNMERIRTTVIDVSRLLEWAARRPEIDPRRLGLVGFSHSGITAALAAVSSPHLAATVIMMAGAHPHRVLASCRGLTGELRQTITSRFGWSDEDYAQALEPLTRSVDVASYPGRAEPSTILLFQAARDDCFPEDSREALWSALGQPERYLIAYGHKISFFSMTPLGFNWMRQPVYDFLDRQLSISAP